LKFSLICTGGNSKKPGPKLPEISKKSRIGRDLRNSAGKQGAVALVQIIRLFANPGNQCTSAPISGKKLIITGMYTKQMETQKN